MDSIARILNAYGVELSKAARWKQTYAGPFLVLMAVLLGLVAQPIQRGGDSGYGFIAYVIPIALGNIGFALTLIYGAGLVAPELGSGAIRQVFVRPLLRHEYVLAKLLTGLTYNAILVVCAVLPAWGLLYLLGDARGITIGGDVLFTDREMGNSFLWGLALTMPAQWAGVSLGLLLSCCTRSPVTAISVSVGGWLIADLVKYSAGAERYLFTTYLESAWNVFDQHCAGMDASWTPLAYLAVGTALPVFVLCTAGAIIVLNRRNLHG